jgi:hypothetical protein
MLEKKLPTGGSSFRMSGSSGFVRKFHSLTNTRSYSSLKDNREAVISIFETLVSTIRRDGKIPHDTRRRAISQFSRTKGVSRIDISNFKKIIEFYK